MKACRDCKHVFSDPENGNRPGCRHPKSFIELQDWYNGVKKTHAQPIWHMRMFDACGEEARLFEKRS
jgi:hypothetical protein